MTHLLQKAIKRLQRMPEEEQDEWASRILQGDLSDDASLERGAAVPYSSFQVLRKARLEGPRNASVTYEQDLYGLGPAKHG